MLTPLPHATVVFHPGFLGRGKGRAIFTLGSVCFQHNVTKAELDVLEQLQNTTPFLVGTHGDRKYWSFRGLFYQEAEGLTADEVYALLVAAEMQHKEQRDRQIANAKAMVAQGPLDSRSKREHIPVEIRRIVFENDGGRCRVCESNFDLQYDHIIPVARGGSSAPENLQLLCGTCNRKKGASLG